MLIVTGLCDERRLPLPDDGRWGIDLLNVPRSDIPAVTHLDYSARIQTVSRERAPLYHELITEFDRITGCPVLVNTSFNVRGEPIVCTPQDAYRCFMRTHLDYLVVGPFLLAKAAQPAFDEKARQQSIPLD
jgi:carbamoyltransferase